MSEEAGVSTGEVTANTATPLGHTSTLWPNRDAVRDVIGSRFCPVGECQRHHMQQPYEDKRHQLNL